MTEYFTVPHNSSFVDPRALHNSLLGRSSFNPYPNGPNGNARAPHEPLSPQYGTQYRPPRGVTYGNAVPEVRRLTRDYQYPSPPDDAYRSPPPPRTPIMPGGSQMPGVPRYREYDQGAPTHSQGNDPTHVDYETQDSIHMHHEPSWIPVPDDRHLSFLPPQASTPAPDARYGDTPVHQPQEVSYDGETSRYPEQGFMDHSIRYDEGHPNETAQTMGDEFDREGYDDEEVEEMDVRPVEYDQSYGESPHFPGRMPESTPYSEPPQSVATHDVPQVEIVPSPQLKTKKGTWGWLYGFFPKKHSSRSTTSKAPPPQQPVTAPVRMLSQRSAPQELWPHAQSPRRVPHSTSHLPYQTPGSPPTRSPGRQPYQSPQNAVSSPGRLHTQSPGGVRPLSPGRFSQRSHGASMSSAPFREQGDQRSGTFSGSSTRDSYPDQRADPATNGRLTADGLLPNPYDNPPINSSPAALDTPEDIDLQHAGDYDAMSEPYPTSRMDTSFSTRVNRVGHFLSELFHLPFISKRNVSVEYRPGDSRRAAYDKPGKSWYSKGGQEKLDLLAGPSPAQMRSPAVRHRRSLTEQERTRARELRRERRDRDRQRERARSTQRDAQRERHPQQHRSRSAPARALSPSSNSSGRAATAIRPTHTPASATTHDGAAVYASPGASSHGLGANGMSTSYIYPGFLQPQYMLYPVTSPSPQGQVQMPQPGTASPLPAGQMQPTMPGIPVPNSAAMNGNVPYIVVPLPMPASGTMSPPPRKHSPRQRSGQRRMGRKGSSESPPPMPTIPTSSARRLSIGRLG